MRQPSREEIALSLAAGACLLMAVAMGWTIVAYNGANDLGYSPFSHLYSELGWAKHSPAAGVFNFCLSTASVLTAPLFWLLGRRLKNLTGRVAAVLGIGSAWACCSVGLIPLGPSPVHLPYQGGRVGLHFLVAVIFFWAWVATMAATLVALLRSDWGRRMRMLIGATVLALAVSLSFLAGPKERIISQLAKGVIKERAAFHWTPTLEWCVAGTICLWLLVAIFSLWERGQRTISADRRHD